ncbi:MAG: hypothetical protein ABR608_02680 [Pseudonocardiaceae bacterium]
MIVTTWDGHLRVDRPADGASVTLTLLTVEPTTEAEVRTGLLAGFVTGDPDGPPARLTIATPEGRLPDDLAALLGTRVAAAVAALAGTGGGGDWLQLDLGEVDDLAAAWAPYRVRVLTPASAPQATVGAWADGLWTALDLPDWRELVGGRAPAPVFRGETSTPDPDPPMASGQWLLPAPMAKEAGCAPTVSWSVRTEQDGTVWVEVEAERVDRDRPGVLLAGVDEPGGAWEPLRADGPDRLRARLAVRGDGPVRLRFRTRPESAS